MTRTLPALLAVAALAADLLTLELGAGTPSFREANPLVGHALAVYGLPVVVTAKLALCLAVGSYGRAVGRYAGTVYAVAIAVGCLGCLSNLAAMRVW